MKIAFALFMLMLALGQSCIPTVNVVTYNYKVCSDNATLLSYVAGGSGPPRGASMTQCQQLCNSTSGCTTMTLGAGWYLPVSGVQAWCAVYSGLCSSYVTASPAPTNYRGTYQCSSEDLLQDVCEDPSREEYYSDECNLSL
jgi:hypothetical protein